MLQPVESTDHSRQSSPLRDQFLRWQCRVRQMAMRDQQGRPDPGVCPEVLVASAAGSGHERHLGQIITVLNKDPASSMTPELLHMARATNDPALIRAQAVQFFGATYFQKHRSFCDHLTAVFAPGSASATTILAAQSCTLLFTAHAQRFSLFCRARRLAPSDPLLVATMAHNRLFNPSLSADSPVLAFDPDWAKCTGGAWVGQ